MKENAAEDHDTMKLPHEEANCPELEADPRNKSTLLKRPRSRQANDQLRKQLKEFEAKYKIKMTNHELMDMIDKRIADRDGLYSPPSRL